MSDRTPKSIGAALPRFALAATLTVLVGCATVEVPEPEPLESELLPVYSTWFAADVEGNAELYEFVVGELQPGVAGSIDRVERIAGGLRLLPGAPPEISSVARGSFPKGVTQMALTTNRAFERRTATIDGSREVYFTQREGFLQLAIPESDTLYLSTGLLLEMLPSRPPADLEIPNEVFSSLVSVGADGEPDALIVFDNPGGELLGALGVDAPALPLQRIDLSVETATDGIRLGGALHLRSETEAALFGRVGRFFVIVFVRALGLDSRTVQDEVSIEVEGSQVVFSNIPMSRDELVVALRAFTGAE